MSKGKRPATGAETRDPSASLSVKEQRDQRRQAKVAAFRQKQERAKRNRLIAIVLSSVSVVAVIAIIAAVVIVGNQPKSSAADGEGSKVQTWDVPGAVHVDPKTVDYEADYGMNPPAGGPHWGQWLNCGVYTKPQQNERAVHALEHGAVWVTYDATAVSETELATLRKRLPSTYIVLSPYKDLPARVVASAWGAQLKLTGVDDKRLDDFIKKYWQSANAPEPGAPCTGGFDGPGRI